MKKLLVLLSTCLALGLVLAACGDDDESDGGGGAAQTEAETVETQATDDTAEGEDAAQVAIRDNEFAPEEVTVKQGGEVTWTHEGQAPHDVTADEFKSGDPGGMKNGDKFTEKFDDAGSFDYVCTVHPGMEGTVKVE